MPPSEEFAQVENLDGRSRTKEKRKKSVCDLRGPRELVCLEAVTEI